MKTMKTFWLLLTIACFTFGNSFAPSTASSDRFQFWDQIEGATAKLYNEQRIDDNELRAFDEVLVLARSGETEEAITTLNAFLKGNRNTELREVASETLSELVRMRREAAKFKVKQNSNKTACSMEMKVCPNGTTLVGREGPNCEFAACPSK